MGKFIIVLSVVGSVMSIVGFFIEVIPVLFRNRSTIKATNPGNSININSNNPTTYIDSHDTNSYTFYPSQRDSMQKSVGGNPSQNQNDPMVFIVFIILIGGVLSKFYLDHQSSIIFWVVFIGVICFSVTLACLILLAKRNLISNRTLYLKTIKWFPLFIGVIFVYHPLYTSKNLTKVEHLIRTGKGYAEILGTYTPDVAFLLLQIMGLTMLAALFILYFVLTIRDTYKSFKHNYFFKNISIPDVTVYFIVLIFVFILVSGLYIKLFNLKSLASLILVQS